MTRGNSIFVFGCSFVRLFVVAVSEETQLTIACRSTSATEVGRGSDDECDEHGCTHTKNDYCGGYDTILGTNSPTATNARPSIYRQRRAKQTAEKACS
jgi:hypothetical protein